MNSRILKVAAAAGAVFGVSLTASAFLTSTNSGRLVPYQGVLERNGARVIDPRPHSMIFTFYTTSNPSNMTTCWVSTAQQVTVLDGVFSVVLGPVSNTCFDATVTDLSVGVSVQSQDDATPFPLLGRQKLLPAPYAISSAQSTDFLVQGNLGLGTSSPTAAIHVERAWGNQTDPRSGLAYLSNTDTGAASNASLALRVNGSTAVIPSSPWTLPVRPVGIGVDNSDSNKFKFSSAWNALDTATRFTIDTAGNVGIGNSNPGAPLDVGGNVMLGLDENSSGTRTLMFRRNAGDEGNSGKIAYRPGFDTTVLAIIGAGAASARNIRMWDNVRVEGNFTAPGNVHDDCYWTGSFCGPNTCNNGYFMAGMESEINEACGGAGDYDFSTHKMYCCHL